MTKKYILEFLTAHKEELQKSFAVKKIGLFGSYAKDMADENSDIDIAIESENKDFFLREDLRDYLQKCFKVDVDIGYIDSFRGYYKSKIDKEIIYV